MTPEIFISIPSNPIIPYGATVASKVAFLLSIPNRLSMPWIGWTKDLDTEIEKHKQGAPTMRQTDK